METPVDRYLLWTCRVRGTIWLPQLTRILSTDTAWHSRAGPCATRSEASLAGASSAVLVAVVVTLASEMVGEGDCQTRGGGVNAVGSRGKDGGGRGNGLLHNSLIRTRGSHKYVLVCCNM